MKKTVLNTLTIAILFFASTANAQVGIGVPAENMHPSAELEVKSTTKGFLPPRMTKAERDAIVAPAAGLLIYQTDGDVTNPAGLYFYDGAAWKKRVGVQGAKGIQGERGAKGEKGDVGPSGPFSMDAGTSTGELKYWDGTKWVSLLPGNNAQKLTTCDGLPTWTTDGVCPGKITAIDCGNNINNGTLTMLTSASDVSVVLTYTGGNGGFYSGQTATSTGVTGLTSTLQAGNFVRGNGSLTYSITGIPSDTGTASFQINIGENTCTFIVKVKPRITPNIIDLDRNLYKTVYIGNQLWMAENLRTTKYSDGTMIPLVIDQAEWAENFNKKSTLPMMSWYNNEKNNFIINKYGALYNWYAITPPYNENKNVCPTGWHLPSDDEWTVLFDFIEGDGGKLKKEGITEWLSPNRFATNTSGFSALPAGFRDKAGNYNNISTNGKWWSSLQHETFTSNVWYRDLNSGNGALFRGFYDKSTGLSVRCLIDSDNHEQNIVMCDGVPTWGTDGICPGKIESIDCGNAINHGTLNIFTPANDVHSVIAYTGGNNGFYSGQAVTSTGVTGLTATLQAGNLVSGNGSLTYSITGIPSDTGTASFQTNIVGNTCTFIVKVNPPIFTDISDVDGNSYKTVNIGNQQWMTENLRTTKYSDGTMIPLVIDQAEWAENFNKNSTLPMMSWYNNEKNNFIINKYGALYNWYAITPLYNENKNVCPTGWHLPSDDEWTVLLDFMEGDGGKLKKEGITEWLSPNKFATNTSGFSALPAGFRDKAGNYNNISINGKWWSSLQHETFTSNVWYRDLNSGNGALFRGFYDKSTGLSVRCIKN